MNDNTMILHTLPDHGNRFAIMFAEFNSPAPDYRWFKALCLIAAIATALTVGG